MLDGSQNDGFAGVILLDNHFDNIKRSDIKELNEGRIKVSS